MGGLVNQVLKSIHVECLPEDIPQFVDLDVTELELGQVLHVSDLSLPDKVKILHRPNGVIVSVQLEKIKEEDEAEEEVAESETEVAGDSTTEEDSDKKDDSTKKED